MGKEFNQRITAIFKPTDRGDLLRLQDQLRSRGHFRPVRPPMLHLTYMHFGRQGELYRELKLFSGRNEKSFNQVFANYVSELTADPVQVQAHIARIGTFGQVTNPILAAELSLPEETLSTRESLLDRLMDDLGVTDVFDWKSQSQILSLAPGQSYRPHITIGHGAPTFEVGEFETLDLPIGLHGIYVRNF